MADFNEELEKKRKELDELGVVKNAWEATPLEIEKSKQIITVKDLLGKTYSSGALSLGEMASSLTTLSNTKIAESSEKVSSFITGTREAITSLEGYNAVISTYRKVKPVVKTAVNIGGLVFNFANAGEMAQDVLQYILVKAQEEVMGKITDKWSEFMDTPVLIVLGEDVENVVETYNELRNLFKSVLNDFLTDLSSDINVFLDLVRKMNDSIINQEGNFNIKDFVEYSSIYVHDVVFNDGYTYFATKLDGIIRIKDSVEEVYIDNIEAKKIYFDTSGNLHYSVEGEVNSVLYVEQFPSIPEITAIGKTIGIVEFDNTIILITDKKISVSTDVLFSASDSIKCFSKFDNKLYYSDGNKVLYLESILLPAIEGLIADKVVETLLVFKDELVVGLSDGVTTEICVYETQPRFIEPICDNFGYTFIKKIGSTIYAVKNRSMYIITETQDEISSELFLTNLPEEISGFIIVPIGSANYYVAATKEMIVVSKDKRWWDEKIIDVEEVGLVSGLITDLYYDGGDIFISTLKSVVKIKASDFIELEPKTTLLDPELFNLPDTPTDESEAPAVNEINRDIDIIPVSKVSEYSDYVYKIHSISSTKIIVSAGSKIIEKEIPTGNTLSERDFKTRLYLSQITEEGVFYTKGAKLYFEDMFMKTVNGDSTLLSMYFHISSGIPDFDRIIVFSKDKCFIRATDEGFTTPIPLEVKLNSRKLFMVSDNNSILLSDGRSSFKISDLTVGAFEIIQIIKGTDNIFLAENSAYVQTENNVLLKNSKNNLLYKNSIYHNGYQHTSFYSKGVGIAPYDYCSNVLIYTNTEKEKYLNSMRESFIKNFKELMNKLPNVVIDEVMRRIRNEEVFISSGNEAEKATVINILKKRVFGEIEKIITDALSLNFVKDTERDELFVSSLIEKLSLTGRHNLTEEFYNIAFNSVSKIIKDIIEQINQVGSYAFWYYDKHKQEWNDKIISEITGNYVSVNKYLSMLNPCREVELSCVKDLEFKLNYICSDSIKEIKLDKTGEITPEDKITLKSLIPNQKATLIEKMENYEDWSEIIGTIVSSVYKVQQQNQYEDIVNDSNMNPIQWDELPEMIDRERFLEELEEILQGRREIIIEAINILVGEGQVNCYSCIDEKTATLHIRRDINKELKMMRSSAHRKLISSSNYENIPEEFYIYDNFGAENSLPGILNKQSDLYVEYLSKVIEIIINDLKYIIVEGEEV